MDETVDIKKLIDSYLWQVNDVEKSLQALAQRADELTREVEVHEQAKTDAQSRREALERHRATLQSERESLMEEHSEATFTQDTGELQRIARRRVALDEELEHVQETIRQCVIPADDYGEHAATLQVEKDSLEQRLPRQFYNTAANMHPMLEAISEVLRADAERLRKRWLAIKIPNVYSKETLESVRLRQGNARKSEPAFLQRKEDERKARMQRFQNVEGNTDSMHAAMRVTYREPEPRTTVTSGESRDGVLSGDDVRRILAEKQSA